MKITDGVIQLNVFDDILDGMTKEQKLELARLICWDDDVLEEFVTRLMTEYASETTDSHIHKARLRFVELMPEAAAQLIRALVAEVEAAKSCADHDRNMYYTMDREWPGHINCPECGYQFYTRQPKRPEWSHFSSPSSDQIMKQCGFDLPALSGSSEETACFCDPNTPKASDQHDGSTITELQRTVLELEQREIAEEKL